MREHRNDSGPRELITARWRIARLLPRAGATLVIALVLVEALLGVLPVVFVVATGIVLGRTPAAVRGGLGSPAWSALVAVFMVAAAAFVAQQIIAPLEKSLGELVARRINGLAFDDLMSASLRSAGIAPLEDQKMLEHLRTAARQLESGFQSPGNACAGLAALLARYTSLSGYAIVVGAAFSWLAAAGLVVAVALFRYGQRAGLRKYSRVWVVKAAGNVRRSEYLRSLAIQPAAGKEIRVFGLAAWLTNALREAWLEVLKVVWAERRRVYLWPFIWFAGWGLAVTAVIFAVLGQSVAGPMTLTGFVLVSQSAVAALRLGGHYPEADTQTAFGMMAHEAIQRFGAGVDAYPAAQGPSARPAQPDPVSTLRFDNVSFRYPGQRTPVFDGLDLTIPVGRCTAIVGVNGSGKTTLIKLLARLYEPSGGAVRVDGADIAAYPLADWRARLAVIFQDFARYEVSAADNIGFGAVGFLDDRAGIRAAASAVGIAETLDALPLGFDTPLARHLTGGAELSGGQWQRVALARALFALRHGASVVVLDEPTASLDVRAEANFFHEFATLTRGATTLLISHRFSTVRHADLIVVLERGRISEQGNHEQLMARNGRYAELFRLQADRFADPARPADLEEATI